jgi:pimeloyl-ACP methyl ester carboxylesterase
VINQVNAEPFTVSLGVEETSIGEDLDVWLDGDSVASVLFEILYVEDWIGLVPGLVAGLARGDETALNLLTILGVELSAHSLRSSALGTYFAVTCADRLPFTSGPPPSQEVGNFAAAVVGDGIAAACERWPVDASPPSAGESVISDLPVLLLSGRFDPITPPDFAVRAAEHLETATLVVRDGASHGTWGFDRCVDGIVTDFMADPLAAPDTSCIDEARPLTWIPIP